METPELWEHNLKVRICKKGDLVLSKLPHVAKGSSSNSDLKTVWKVLRFYNFLLSYCYVWNMQKPFSRETHNVMDMDAQDSGRAENPPDEAEYYMEKESQQWMTLLRVHSEVTSGPSVHDTHFILALFSAVNG